MAIIANIGMSLMRLLSVGEIVNRISQRGKRPGPWWVTSVLLGVALPYPVIIALGAGVLSVMAWPGSIDLDNLTLWGALMLFWTVGIGGTVYVARITVKAWSETPKDHGRILATGLSIGLVVWGGTFAANLLWG